MRIDQYLWCIRLFKSRNSATTACKKGLVSINNQKVKPSREVLPLDRIDLRKNQLGHQIQVIAIPKSRVGAKLVGLYCTVTISSKSEERKELQQLTSSAKRDRGTGRPTKKERRELDRFEDDDESGSEKIN
ncbi:MAG: S4 domain-containing protein [Flavobacteriaceae bacterium]